MYNVVAANFLVGFQLLAAFELSLSCIWFLLLSLFISSVRQLFSLRIIPSFELFQSINNVAEIRDLSVLKTDVQIN